MKSKGAALVLDGSSLNLDGLAALARGERPALKVSKKTLTRAKRSRRMVEKAVSRGEVVYGLTTGFGKLKSVAIAAKDLGELQRNLVLSHCAGVGEPMPINEVRIAQVLRLNGILRGHSGVREVVIEQLIRFHEKDFVPVVPQQGSVGASGDLAPLSQMTAAYMGYGEAYVGGKRMTATAALRKIGEKALVLEAKEGLALINGTEIMKATGCATWARAVNLSKAADAICSLTIEALMGSAKPFDARLAELKRNAGHARASANVRACLAGSLVLASHADCDRVQDAYSLRCVPQIHGATKTALAHVTEVLGDEINAVTDNPLLFPDTNEVISAGMFHGQQLSMLFDYLGIAFCTLANVSERRIEQMVNPDLSGLPAFLAPKPGLHSGFMIAQVTAAALISENKIYAHPASVDSVPTSAGQEDHVSMGVTAARKARQILDNVEAVLAIELMCAAQGREFNLELLAGQGAEAAYGALRGRVKPLAGDRFLHPDIEAARQLLASGELVAAVEDAVGELEA